MATEYKLSYTASEINSKLATVDETKSALENDYYTSTDIDTKLEEVNTSIDDIETGLQAKADLVDGKIPTEQLPDDIGGGVASWNDLEDKPFEEISVAQTITWDGNTEGLPVTSIETDVGADAPAQVAFYKMSDIILTEENALNCIFNYTNSGETETLSVNVVDGKTSSGSFYLTHTNAGAPVIFNCAQAGDVLSMEGLSLTFPEAGVWFLQMTIGGMVGIQTNSLIIPSIIKTLDIKYLPSNMALGYEERTFEDITWDGKTDGLVSQIIDINMDGAIYQAVFCKTGAFVPKESLIGASVTHSNGETDTIAGHHIQEFDTGSCILPSLSGGAMLLIVQDNETVNLDGINVTFSEAGIWFMVMCFEGEFINDYIISLKFPSTLVQIDEKFIPDTIARQSDLDNIDLSNYYTKSEVDTALDNVSVDLSDYYTKDETYSKTEVDTALNNIDLSNYYTKNETYNKTGVYTKTEVDTVVNNLESTLNNNYYTKSEIDEITGDIDAVLDEISALIGE